MVTLMESKEMMETLLMVIMEMVQPMEVALQTIPTMATILTVMKKVVQMALMEIIHLEMMAQMTAIHLEIMKQMKVMVTVQTILKMTPTVQVKMVILMITKVLVTTQEMEVKETLITPPLIIKTRLTMIILTMNLKKTLCLLLLRNLNGLKNYRKQACQ